MRRANDATEGLLAEARRTATAWPDRLVLVDREGRVAYRGVPGPFGFKPDEFETAIERELGLTASP